MTTSLFAINIPMEKPTLNKVYRTDKNDGKYCFLLLTNSGSYYHVQTNKTEKLTPKQIKSPSISDILNGMQSWGEAFISKGKYTTQNGKLYTKKNWKRINILSSKKIKYRGKTFYLK